MPKFASIPRWLFGSDRSWRPGFLTARWLFLRSLGLIFFSAFYSLLFQIRGLIGPNGLLPAGDYLQNVRDILGLARFWYAPSLFWVSSGDRALSIVCWIGLIASLALIFNFWPRASILVCLVAFLSFVSTAQDFSGYQSDGMLLEAGFLSLFLAPPGFRPGLGEKNPASRASWFLLVWLCFRIYFESGIVKVMGHDPEWRNFTAMDNYYQNGPLPTWIGWYVQHWPHWFHAASAVLTLAIELVLAFAMFLPRRFRIGLFFIITPWQIGIILTANYAFLNYLVLVLGFLLLDDTFLRRFLPQRFRISPQGASPPEEALAGAPSQDSRELARPGRTEMPEWRRVLDQLRLSFIALVLTWDFYATSALLIAMLSQSAPLPVAPVRALYPFRIANDYGLFAVMTRNRYEIEFQGSRDGQDWIAFPFRYKPQDTSKPPRIYAPYQPRFDWNLWFASLSGWREYPFVINTEERLLTNDPQVLSLFAGNPFPGSPPTQVRVVLWQYWFTDSATKRATGQWWRRELVGLYAPSLERTPDGHLAVTGLPGMDFGPSDAGQ
ncbi:MAG: lipase maturation factor family protein [Candidatus Acidiferrales bacterium]